MTSTTLEKLAGMTALVTGGSRGIGAAIAKRLASDGASVAITYSKDADAAGAVVKSIESAGGKALAIQATASNSEAVANAVKQTVKMFAQGLAREVGDRGIEVNNVQPGPIDTDLNPAAGEEATPQIANTALKRYGHVDEVAALVPFVAGPEAGYITGANLTVDGGTNA
jgi:NAD(P)-dependent dehydrogenase (short-subunit alcohol dehydrogenase family)